MRLQSDGPGAGARSKASSGVWWVLLVADGDLALEHYLGTPTGYLSTWLDCPPGSMMSGF